MEHEMWSFTTVKAADRFPLHRDRSAEDPPPTKHLETDASLPRHLLVSLAGITAEVTSLQQRCVDAPDLHASIERIVGRLDGLVDSIYQRAADPLAPSVHRSGSSAEMPVDFAGASNVAPTPSESNAHPPTMDRLTGRSP
jgi:hypothetical protein